MPSSATQPFAAFLADVPPPPVNMAMPDWNLYITIANYAVLALVSAIVIRGALRRRSWVGPLVLAGAAIASLQEPIYDIVGAVWYPHAGAPSPFHAFGISVSAWLLPAYAWYIGGMGCWAYAKFRQGGVGKTQIWQMYGLFWLANFALEMPGLNLGIYAYYGEQPFRLLQFPAWMAMTNALMPIVLGITLWKLEPFLRGPRVLLVLAVTPMATGFPQIAVGWPTWLALNGGHDKIVTHLAALVSLGLSLSVLYMAGLLFGVEKRRAVPLLSRHHSGPAGTPGPLAEAGGRA